MVLEEGVDGEEYESPEVITLIGEKVVDIKTLSYVTLPSTDWLSMNPCVNSLSDADLSSFGFADFSLPQHVDAGKDIPFVGECSTIAESTAVEKELPLFT
jgi:hypothetical protein